MIFTASTPNGLSHYDCQNAPLFVDSGAFLHIESLKIRVKGKENRKK